MDLRNEEPLRDTAMKNEINCVLDCNCRNLQIRIFFPLLYFKNIYL